MSPSTHLKLLFILNPRSGNSSTDWPTEITNYFQSSNHVIELYQLTETCNRQTLHDRIDAFKPDRVIAVGGDGTVRLVAECLINQNIPLGILPAGSANGMARELGISNVPAEALAVLEKDHWRKIHAIDINGELCIHLSDLGLNAHAMKKFESQRVRGMWGYLMASIKVWRQNPGMKARLQLDGKTVDVQAEIIIIANATQYGNGAVVNPIGQLDDQLFEIIAFKEIRPAEVLKVTLLHTEYDPDKTEIFQTRELTIRTSRKVHFQVDGEYLGKVNEVKARLLPDALQILVPAPVD